MRTSYDAGPVDVPILEETLGANFERMVAAAPDAAALVEVATGRRWTYAKLDSEVDSVARGLMASGVAKGDRVGIWAPNCAEWVILQLATAKIGAILVNINPAYRTHELAYVLKQSGVRTLVSATAYKSSDYVTMVAEVQADCPELVDVIFLARSTGTGCTPSRSTSVSCGLGPASCRTSTRSTFNTPRGQQDFRKGRRSATATFSTTDSSSAV